MEIDCMMKGREARSVGQIVEGPVDHGLDLFVEHDVFDDTTVETDQMVVMANQRLGELEMGVIARRDHSAYRPTGFQHVEVPIGRGLTQLIVGLEDLGQCQGPVGDCDDLDESSTSRGVAVLMTGEQGADLIVEPMQITRPFSGHGSHVRR
jgi:hypothetical protein